MQASDIIDKANSYSLFELLGTMYKSSMIPLDYSVCGIINGFGSYRFWQLMVKKHNTVKYSEVSKS